MANISYIYVANYQNGNTYHAFSPLSDGFTSVAGYGYASSNFVSAIKFKTSSPASAISLQFYTVSPVGGYTDLKYKVTEGEDSSLKNATASTAADGTFKASASAYTQNTLNITRGFKANTEYVIYLWTAKSTDYYSYISFRAYASSYPLTMSYTAASSYTLTSSASTGSSLTVSINSSPFGRSGNLSSGSTIYAGEVLKFVYSVSSGYVIATHTVNGSSFSSGDTRAVSGNISVVVSANNAISEISASNGTFGTSITISITTHSASYTYTLKATCGPNSATIVSGATAPTQNWTPPASWMNSFTTVTSANCTLTVETYLGATRLGSNSVTVLLSMPTSGANSIIPTPSIVVSDAMGYAATYGGYIPGKSKFSVTVTDGLKFGASISTRSTSANGATYTATSFTTNPISSSASSISTVVKDSRGKTATVTQNVTILSYDNPMVTSFAVHRCDSSGTPDENGDYFYASWGAKVYPLNNLNTRSLTMKYRATGDPSWTSVTITLTAYTQSGSTSPVAVSADSSYDVQLILSDAFGSVTMTAKLSTVAAVIDLLNNGKGAAFGKVAETSNLLDVAWGARIRDSLTVDGGGNIAKADVEISASIDTEFDAKMFHTAQGITGGVFPSDAQNRYGAGITIPYRKPHGNTSTDFAVQIWAPNGDASNGNNLYYRTSSASAWKPWKTVQVVDTEEYSFTVSYAAGTIGTRGYQSTVALSKVPKAVSISYIQDSSAINPLAFWTPSGGGATLYFNAYRATASAVSSNSVRVTVMY